MVKENISVTVASIALERWKRNWHEGKWVCAKAAAAEMSCVGWLKTTCATAPPKKKSRRVIQCQGRSI